MPRTDRLRLAQVEANTYNPNRMDREKRKALRNMIAKYGFLQPMLVRPVKQEFPGDPEAQYVLVDGEQRFDTLRDMGTSEADFVILDEETSEADAQLLTLVMNELRGKHIPLKHAEILVDLSQEIGRDALLAAGFTDGDLDKANELAGPIVDDPEPEPLDEPKDFKVRLTPDQMETVKRAVAAAKVIAQSDRDDVALVALASEFLATYPEADPVTNGG